MSAQLTDRDRIEAIGEQYVKQSVFPNELTAETQRAYGNIVRINAEKFDRMTDEIDVIFTEDDPYDSYEDMKERVSETDTMKVFSGGSEPPLMTHDENVIGRAVHDYFGHLSADCDFSAKGEYQKWKHVWPDYSDSKYDLEARILFAEVVGQLAACYYLPDGFGDDRFEQRAFPAPVEWIDTFESIYS